jgi:hypothetical protein
MTNIEHKDFTGYYYDVFPDGYCQSVINNFENIIATGAGWSRLQGEKVLPHYKDDFSICYNSPDFDPTIPFFEIEDRKFKSANMFFDGLQACFDDYTSKYSILKDSFKLHSTSMKMQKTAPGGGYHIWHCENAGEISASRVLVFMLYLNSFPGEFDGGETEFLYLKQRVKPQENLLIIWPSGFTHTHRGNPVLADKYKYVITGWFNHSN